MGRGCIYWKNTAALKMKKPGEVQKIPEGGDVERNPF